VEISTKTKLEEESEYDGHNAVIAVYDDHSAAKDAVVVGGLSAIGAGLHSMGIPKDSIVTYETAIKAANIW
jgi:hypothetical protein